MSLPSNKVPCKSPYDDQALKPGEIRLLTIVWTTSDEFELQTECHTLTDELEFDAISYVWGTAPASVGVKCNDAVLVITPSAFEMLGYLYLFKPEPKRPLWIDAICINQSDSDEKAVQVPQMHRVYSLANSVIVWVGRSTPETTLFMTEMSRLPGPWDREPAASEFVLRWPSIKDPFWTGMVHLISAEWFRRMWTFQEAVLAKQAILLCGHLWLDLIQLLEFAVGRYFGAKKHPFNRVRLIDYGAMARCHFTLSYRQGGQVGSWEIIGLLHTMRRCQMGEEIDRIWSLLGLFDEDVQKRLEPLVDYSTVAREQYWVTLVKCMKVIVQMSQELELLGIPSPEGSRNPHLPSWCPDLRGRGDRSRIINGRWNVPNVKLPPHHRNGLIEEDATVTNRRYKAVSRHARALFSTSEKENTLRIRGFEVDTILKVTEDRCLVGAWDYMADFSSPVENFKNKNPLHIAAMQWIVDGQNLARRTYQKDDNGARDLPDEFLMAFWTDHRISEQIQTAYEDAMEALAAGNYLSIWSLEREKALRAEMCVLRLRRIMGHSFFSTAGGRFGLATPGCKPGDKICVFYGGEPLYIIRPHGPNTNSDGAADDAESRWEFVGTAYVPHLMDQHTTDDARQKPDQIFALA